jgi:hypothetical protein
MPGIYGYDSLCPIRIIGLDFSFVFPKSIYNLDLTGEMDMKTLKRPINLLEG